jgi:hypothetical protein
MLRVLEALEKRFENLERSFADRLASLETGLGRCCSESARRSDELQARSERLALHDKLCFLQTSVDGLATQSATDSARTARTAGRASLRLSIFLVQRDLARQSHHSLHEAFSSWGGHHLRSRPASGSVKSARPGDVSLFGSASLPCNGNGPPEKRGSNRDPASCFDVTTVGGPDGALDPLIASDPANAPPLAPEPVGAPRCPIRPRGNRGLHHRPLSAPSPADRSGSPRTWRQSMGHWQKGRRLSRRSKAGELGRGGGSECPGPRWAGISSEARRSRAGELGRGGGSECPGPRWAGIGGWGGSHLSSRGVRVRVPLLVRGPARTCGSGVRAGGSQCPHR